MLVVEHIDVDGETGYAIDGDQINAILPYHDGYQDGYEDGRKANNDIEYERGYVDCLKMVLEKIRDL